MAKSFLGEDTGEYVGEIPAAGYKLVIEEIEISKTGETARTAGGKMYKARFRVAEPKKNAGAVCFDNFVVGTEDDLRAKMKETWVGSPGSKKLKRLLKRASVACIDGDEEEWMDAAQGQEVCAH